MKKTLVETALNILIEGTHPSLKKIKDVQKRLLKDLGGALKVKPVGVVKGSQSKGTVPDKTHATGNVWLINGKYLYAYKAVGTAPWSYVVFDKDSDLKSWDLDKAILQAGDQFSGGGKVTLDDLIDSLK
jgi:hypothetical protein